MKTHFYYLVCASLSIWLLTSVASPAGSAKAPAQLELQDQFGNRHTLSFPSTNLTLITIADRKGSEQIEGWVAPLKAKFGDRLRVHGIADVSGVPRPLRALVRKQIEKAQSYPILLDWSGKTVEHFGRVPGKANVLLLSAEGNILMRYQGAAKAGSLAEIASRIDRALARAD